MNKHKRSFMIVAVVLAVVIVIGGITVAAVSFGAKANEKHKASQASEISEEDLRKATELIDAFIGVDNVVETEVATEEVIPDGIPAALWHFANENSLTLDLWPEEVIEMLNKYPETEEFVLNYPLLKDETFDIDISDSGYEDKVPLFLQWDKRWGYVTYGDDMIANAGCGPTCLSMVACHLLQDPSLDPKAVAEFSTDYGYCCPGDGSYRSLIHEGGEILGLTVDYIENDEDTIISYLSEGYPLICAVTEGDFTYGGHYIVLADYVNGKIKVNDPNSEVNSERLWDYSEIADQIDDIWVCMV